MNSTDSQEKFFEALRAAKPNFQWYLGEFNEIRAYSPKLGIDWPFCPLTAIYYDRTNVYSSTYNFEGAGKNIGLNRNESEIIASASDRSTSKLYPQILAIVGLNAIGDNA
jgi:hypothetical protein